LTDHVAHVVFIVSAGQVIANGVRAIFRVKDVIVSN